MRPDFADREKVLSAFSNVRARLAAQKPYLLNIGPLKVKVEADEEIVRHWLRPALSHSLIAGAETKEAAMTLRMAVGREVSGMESLCSWAGSGAKNGIYESVESAGNMQLFDHGSQFWAFWSPEHREAHVWLADPGHLPPWEFGAPLKALFHWMCCAAGLQLIHGGAVGRDTGGVLLAGPGGAGKSTTALSCLGSGLKYLADDYCVIEPGPPVVVHQLYANAKLRPENLHRFEHLRNNFAWKPEEPGAKPMMFLDRTWDHLTIRRLPLRAIVMPRVSGVAGTRWKRSSAAKAWRAIAPSTIWQLPACQQKTFQNIAALSRSLPAFELQVGTNLEAIPNAIEELLRHLEDSR
jgi:hypothetical protein